MLAVKQRSNKFCLIQIKTTKEDIFSPYCLPTNIIISFARRPLFGVAFNGALAPLDLVPALGDSLRTASGSVLPGICRTPKLIFPLPSDD